MIIGDFCGVSIFIQMEQIKFLLCAKEELISGLLCLMNRFL